MSVDTPARIVIIGATPVGLEAALYARYLGYDIDVYEPLSVGHSLQQAGDVVLPQTAGANRTPLGLAALRAQHEDCQDIDPNAQETARQFAESYFLPLAATDLLVDGVHVGHTVLRIERTEFPDEDDPETVDENAHGLDDDMEVYEELEYAPFALTVRRADGSEFTMLAEIVIDATCDSAFSSLANDALRITSEVTGDGTSPRFQTPEPNYYVLGAKTAGEVGSFNLSADHDQIRQLFAIVGGRATLNLYATFQSG